MITKTFASVAVMSTLGLLAPMQAHAFGLGKLELSSALNEPFKAEIVITALRDTDAGNLQVQLASNKEFERAGLERSYLLTQFTFELIESAGQTKVVISSKQAVKEPLLDFLLSATTGNGRLIREYTVLLDPPKNIFRQVEKTSTPPKSTSSEKQSQVQTTDYQYPAPSLSSNNATSYGPTDQTDTLWHVALKTRPEKSVSVHQMMMALLEENSTAFIRNNINGLKAGYTLSIPSIDVINQLSKKQAVNAVSEQNNVWKNRNKKTVPVEIVEEASVSDTSSTEIEPTQEQEELTTGNVVTAENTDTTSRLKLVVPDDELSSEDSDLSPLGDATISDLSEQLTFAQETIEGQAQENIDINSRMDVMEEQIQTLRRLISLKDADLARLQSLLEEEGQDVSLEKLTDETLALLQGEDDNQQNISADTVAEDEMEILESETEKPMSGLADESEVVEQPMSPMDLSSISSLDDAITYTSELSGIDEDEIQSVVDKIKAFVTENKRETMLAGLLLLLMLWLIIRRINRPEVTWDDAVGELDDTESEPTITSPDYQVENELDDAQEVVDIEAEKTVEDLIDDADVYVNYDDLTKAKLVLEEAQDKEPSNELVIQKLLFVLFKQQQTDEFVRLVEQSELDKESLAWAEVVDWGRKLAPDHELFKQDELDEQEIVSDVVAEPTPDEIEPLDVSALELESSELEFNLDEEQTSDSSSEDEGHDDLSSFNPDINIENQAEDTLQIDPLESDNSAFDAPLSLEIGDEAELSLDDAPILDINDAAPSTELEGLEEIDESELNAATQALSGDDEVDFDLDFDEIDEAETKLDLASAYVDMGDADGAKSILEEVISEGNDDQKTRAQSLLDSLS